MLTFLWRNKPKKQQFCLIFKLNILKQTILKKLLCKGAKTQVWTCWTWQWEWHGWQRWRRIQIHFQRRIFWFFGWKIHWFERRIWRHLDGLRIDNELVLLFWFLFHLEGACLVKNEMKRSSLLKESHLVIGVPFKFFIKWVTGYLNCNYF